MMAAKGSALGLGKFIGSDFGSDVTPVRLLAPAAHIALDTVCCQGHC